ncbi:MAG: N-acetylmuramoyl-L-alanine amidase [Clostridia bacterium]|nr:N-acetylmuramoyl-L-alanine amidase [Clostridia bacterium]
MGIKIMLDAGHYGKYNSGIVPGYYESDMAWTLHKFLKEELESYGFEVGVTREDKDKDLEVYLRGSMAEGYDLFISLHSNAVGHEPTKRVVAIYPVSGRGKDIAEKLGRAVLETMALSSDRYNYLELYKKPYSSVRPDTDWYGVIRGAVAAGSVGIILEHSFHTNREACRFLMNEDNLRLLAKAEAKVLAEHYGYTRHVDIPKKPAARALKTGDVVTVRPGAVWVTGKPVPSFVYADRWRIKSITPGRAVIDENESGRSSINSAIDPLYLTLWESEESTPARSPSLKVGDRVTLSPDGVVYGTERRFADFVYRIPLYLRSLSENGRAVISTLKNGAVTGAVDVKYLSAL